MQDILSSNRADEEPASPEITSKEHDEKQLTTRRRKALDSEGLFPDVINLNVGGKKFTTTRATLCRVKESMLTSMFSGLHPKPARIQDGHYIMDRNRDQFHYILEYLRVGGVVSLPNDEASREALAVEADYYGLDEVTSACCMLIIDNWSCLSRDVQVYRSQEEELRSEFSKRLLIRDGPAANPLSGLVSLFGQDLDYTLPRIYKPLLATEMKGISFTGKSFGKPGDAMTVSTKDKFISNFNKNHPNMLDRLGGVLQEEPVCIAGGSVLRAILCTAEGTEDRWLGDKDEWDKKGDIDIFIHAAHEGEATRIAKRIFYGGKVVQGHGKCPWFYSPHRRNSW